MWFMDNFWFYVVLIVLIGSYFDYKKSLTQVSKKMNQMEEGQVQKELEAIKQRLAVLERIVTDRNYELHDEFSRLGK